MSHGFLVVFSVELSGFVTLKKSGHPAYEIKPGANDEITWFLEYRIQEEKKIYIDILSIWHTCVTERINFHLTLIYIV